jgi:hypothetical protein
MFNSHEIFSEPIAILGYKEQVVKFFIPIEKGG